MWIPFGVKCDGMRLVVIGDKVPLGTFHLHSRFAHVLNYRNESCIISLIDSDKYLSGRTIHVSGLPQGDDPVQVSSSQVVVARTRVSRDGVPRFDSTFGGFSHEQDFTALIDTMKTVLDARAPERSLAALYHPRHARGFASGFEKAVLERFFQAFETLRRGDVVGSVERFRGVGFGLTPSGDDFIIGLLQALSSLPPSGALRTIKQEILERASGCAELSWQFMRDAEAGIYPKDIKELFTAARDRNPNGVEQHIGNVLSHGHSSGADTLAGLVAGFEWFSARRGGVAAVRIRG